MHNLLAAAPSEKDLLKVGLQGSSHQGNDSIALVEFAVEFPTPCSSQRASIQVPDEGLSGVAMGPHASWLQQN